MYERLIYVSRAAPGVGAREAYDIIRTAHNRNSQTGLTGALLLADQYFIQVLEGPVNALRARFAVIAVDPRHTDVDVRLSVPVTTRCFPNDWMALRDADAISAALRQRFGYLPGLPSDRFPASQVLAFVQACYEAALDPAG
jgi:hypothetical protein